MKRILFTTVPLGVLLLAAPALGADLPIYSKAPVAPTYDWSGFYVGVFGGGGYGNHNINNATGNTLNLTGAGFANFTANSSAEGAVAGGEIGYNAHATSNILIGIEAQGFWSGIKGSDVSQVAAGAFPGVNGAVDTDNLRYAGSLVARAGYTVDRLLLFFEGGWAFGSILHTSTNTAFGVPPGPAFVAADRFNVQANGLTAGGGIGYAITNNLIGKIEYRYYNFNTYSSRGTPFTVNGQLPYTVESTYSTLTLGLDYKFGGPVIAKY